MSPAIKTRKSTPAARAKARRDPKVGLPTQPPKAERDLHGLYMRTAAGVWLIGPRLRQSGCEIELTMDGASELRLALDDQDGAIAAAIAGEAMRLADGVRVVIDDVTYVLRSCDVADDGGIGLLLEDQAAWRLRQFTRYVSKSRKDFTRAEFFYLLVQEASRAPLAPMKAFIPELHDDKPVAAKPRASSASKPSSIDPPKRTSSKRSGSGTPSKGGLQHADTTVKGKRATARQRDVLAGGLAEAQSLGASHRVMVAGVMALTQESRAGEENQMTGDDDTGLLQQGREWISVANVDDPRKAMRAFLLGGEANVGGTERSKKGWKQHFGSLKNAPGDLAELIHKVQGNARASDYSPWQAEATRTVDAFLGGDLAASSSSSGSQRTYTVRYLFERGSRDGDNSRESSWDAMGRLAEEVKAHRWAALNTLNFASGEELAAAAPSAEINPGDDWLLGRPTWEWGVDRPISEITIRVLSERWGVLPGAVVMVAGHGALDGRYLVASVRDDLFSPETEVTLRRPVLSAPEPRSETRTVDTGSDDAEDTGSGDPSNDAADRLYAACEHIASQNRDYKYGGGHGKALSAITASEPLDCSSSTSLALYQAGLFGKRTTAIVSGDVASSYGKPGRGEDWTIWANPTHVWIEFHGDRRFKRFDTAGPGEKGPRMRTTGRNDQHRFTGRHLDR